MTQATLFVSRFSDTELRFVLQRSQAPRPPLVLQDSTQLRPEQRQKIRAVLSDFAKCLVGRHADEPKFLEIGRVLYSMLLPESIRVDLQSLRDPLVILTDDATLPWEVLHDGGDFLTTRLPVARQLIIHRQMAGLLRTPEPPAADFAALVIADPLGDLPGARTEGQTLADLFRTRGPCDLLVGPEATWDEIQRRLVRRAYSVIHVCGHMEYDVARRLSSIPLGDGGQLSADEVVSTFRGSPVVFLNGCTSDSRPPAGGGADQFARAESFAQAFMFGNERGVASAVIATMWLVPDEPPTAVCEFARGFYETLLGGGKIGEALQKSRSTARRKQHGPMVWGPYVLYGDPTLAPFVAADTADGGGDDTGKPVTRDMVRKKKPPAEPPPPIPTPAADPSPFADLAAAAPLDDTARQVFHMALREMGRLGQTMLTSMHFLIGLCEAAVPPLVAACEAVDLDHTCVANRTRRRAKRLLDAAPKDSGISPNVVRMLVLAAARAERFGRETVIGDDLVVGLLRSPESEAAQILRSFGLTPDVLLGELPAPPEAGLKEWAFDPTARPAVDAAVQLARAACLPFLGTPHVLAGLLKVPKGRAAGLFQKHNLDPAAAAQAFAAAAGQGPPDPAADERPLDIRPRCREVFQRAAGLAGGTGPISEQHLLVSVLTETTGATVELLKAMRLDPAALLAAART